MRYDLDTEDRIRRALSAMEGFAELLSLAGEVETMKLRRLAGLVCLLTDELMEVHPVRRHLRGGNDDE